MKKKFLCFGILIILVVALGVMSSAFTVSAYADVKEEDIDISSEADWIAFSQKCRTSGYVFYNVELNTDIYFDRSDASLASSDYSIHEFVGNFNGNGHALVGFTLNSSQPNSSRGVFGTVYGSSIIRNLNIVDADISSSKVNSSYGVALVAYKNYGTIENVNAYGKLSAVGVAGGITVYNGGTIANCTVIADVTLTGYLKTDAVGGKVSLVQGDIIETSGTLSPSSHVGTVTCYNALSSGTETIKGSISGTFADVKVTRHTGTFSNENPIYAEFLPSSGLNYCYVSGIAENDAIIGGNYTAVGSEKLTSVGGVYAINDIFDLLWLASKGDLSSDKASLALPVNIYSRKLSQTLLSFIAGDNFDFNNSSFYNISGQTALLSYAFADDLTGATLSASASLQGEGTEVNPYLISSTADFLALCGGNAAQYTQSRKYLRLTQNISLIDGNKVYSASIASFEGTFDGAGFAIGGVVTNSALFATNSGVIKNLFVHGRISSATDNNALLVGENSGTIENVEVNAALVGNTSAAIAGINTGSIEHCTVRTFGQGKAAVACVINDSEVDTAVAYTRSYSTLPFVYEISEERLSALRACYTEGSGWVDSNKSFTSMQVISSIQKTASGLVYNFVGDETLLSLCSSTKTDFGSATDGWAYIAGSADDVPGLVFVNDGLSYKKIVGIAVNDAEATYDEDVIYDISSQDSSKNILANVFKYSEAIESNTEIAWFVESNESWQELSSNFSSVGRYKIAVTMHSTETIKGGYAEAVLTIKNADIVLTADDFFAIDGITSALDETVPDNAVAYSSVAKVLNTFVPDNLSELAIIDWSIISYDGYKEVSALPSEVKDAGEYVLKFTAEMPNYNKYETEVYFTISRVDLNVTPIIGFTTIEFGANLSADAVSYSVVTGGTEGALVSGETVAVLDFDAFTFDTDYVAGTTPVGAECTITVKEVTGKYVSNNYNIIGGSVKFGVIRTSIDTSKITFKDVSCVYDGKSHVPSYSDLADGVSGTLMYKAEGDVYVELKDEKFIDTGKYYFKLYITAGENYSDAALFASVTITPKSLKIKGVDYTITYGAPVPTYAVEEYSLAEREDGKSADTGFAGKLTCSCDYRQNDDVQATPFEIIWSGLYSNNYSISYTSGKLTLEKASRDIKLTNATMNYNKNSDGSVDSFVPVYNSSNFTIQSEDYYILQDEIYTAIVGAPKESGIYKLVMVTQETNNYRSCEFTYTVTIVKKTLTGLSLALDGGIDCLGDANLNVEAVYNGNVHSVDLYGAMPQGEEFSVTYYYGEESSSKPFEFTNVVKNGGLLIGYKNLSVTVSGNANYEELTLTSKTLVITPSTLYLNDIPSLNYTSEELVPSITYTGTVYGNDIVNFTYAATQGIKDVKIVKVGEYTITVTSQNDNYCFATEKTLTVLQNTIVIDWSEREKIEFEYGNVKKEFSYELSFEASGVSLTKTVTINANTSSSASGGYVLSKGSYNIVDSGQPKKYAVTSDDDGFLFESLNGAGALVVKQKTIAVDFSSKFSSEYTYTGSVLASALTIAKENIAERVGNDSISVEITINGEVKNVGTYVATAKLAGSAASKYTLAEPSMFAIEVKPAVVELSIDNVTVSYGSAVPQYSHSVISMPSGLELPEVVYLCDYSPVTAVGEYEISATVVNVNFAVKATKGIIKVTPATMSGIVFANQSHVYSGEGVAFGYVVPNGAEVSFSETPVHVGTYSVTMSVSKANYLDETRSADIEIIPANVEVFTDTIYMNYTENRDLTVSDFASGVQVKFNGEAVQGELTLAKGTKLKFGSAYYSLGFVPSSADFNSPEEFTCQIVAKLGSDALTLQCLNGNIQDGVLKANEEGTKYLTITIKDFVNYSSGAVLYVNGVAASLGSYIFVESEKNVKIEIKYSGITLYTATFDVEISDSVESDESTEGDISSGGGESAGKQSGTESESGSENGGGNGSDGTEEKDSNLGLIIGLSVGGGVLLIGAAVAVVIIIMKKKNVGMNYGSGYNNNMHN